MDEMQVACRTKEIAEIVCEEAQKAMLVRVQARLAELPAEKTAALREHARALEEAADAAERKDE